MKMLKVSLAAISMLAAGGCGNAEASDLDPSEPLHCILVLEMYKEAAESLGRPKVAETLRAASTWYGRRTAHLPESERSLEVFLELETRIKASEDTGEELAEECLRRHHIAQRREG